MDRLEVLPSILWKVENFWNSEKKFRQSLSFLGMNWKLKLLCLPEAGGIKIKLILKRMSPMTLSHDANFTVDTCLLSHYGGDQYFKQTLSATLIFKEWGIWTQFKGDIERQEYVNYRSGLMFLIVVTPGDKWSTLLQHAYRKQPDTIEMSSCLQSLTENLGAIFDSDVHTDVTLVSGKREFRAHKAVLSARSEVFNAMFRSDMRESREGTVKITDVETDVLEQFLLYLYTGEVKDQSAKTARKLYAVADKYAVDSLKVKCASVITESYKSGAETKLPRSQPNVVVYLNEAEKIELRKKELTRDVVVSKEWRTLSQEFPKLVADMFKPLMEIVEEEPPPLEKQEEDTTEVEE